MDFNQNRYTVAGEKEDFSDGEGDEKQESKEDSANPYAQFARDARASSLFKARRPTKVTLANFHIVKQIGRGTFGRVYLAELDVNKQLYAIKAIRKDVLIEYD